MDNTELTIFGQDPKAVNAFRVDSEEDAWTLLQNLQKADYAAPDDIVFGDWINLEICLQGEKWKSSLTPAIFPVFETLQRTVYRAYAEAKYGNKKQRLTKEEREKLEIIIRVSEGSSIIDTLVNFGEIAKAAVDNMESKHITIAIVVAVLTIGGTTVHKHHIQAVKDTRQQELSNDDKKATLEALQFAGEQETERMKILWQAIESNELAKSVFDEAEDLHDDMLRSATKAEKSKIEGVELDGEIAQELVKSKRVKPEPLQINGFFQVMKLEWHSATLADITLKRVEDGMVVKAAFDLAWFNDEHKEIIKNAEWDEENPKVIKANINARISQEGRISDAELARVDAVTEEDYDNIEASAGEE